MARELIIFDMDGTLIDSSRLLANTINHVRAQLSLPSLPHDQIIGQVNNHQINPAYYFYEVEHFEPIHEEWFSNYYTAHHSDELELYDGIYEILSWLRKRGTMIALATNAYRSSTLESLRHLKIEHFFDAIVCHDDVEKPKPAPDMLYALLNTLNVPQHNALFIGDGPRDEEAAEAARIDYIMVDWGFTDHDNDKEVISSVQALKNALKDH
jgi:phosphoglycolate phosphatase